MKHPEGVYILTNEITGSVLIDPHPCSLFSLHEFQNNFLLCELPQFGLFVVMKWHLAAAWNFSGIFKYVSLRYEKI